MHNLPHLLILGACPKAVAVQAKAHALRTHGLPAPEITGLGTKIQLYVATRADERLAGRGPDSWDPATAWSDVLAGTDCSLTVHEVATTHAGLV